MLIFGKRSWLNLKGDFKFFFGIVQVKDSLVEHDDEIINKLMSKLDTLQEMTSSIHHYFNSTTSTTATGELRQNFLRDICQVRQ